ncbi:MAG: hypothetical protein D6812_07100, partial [Deltaproteobacteria bacterium]
LTTDANEAIAPIHPRMPVILPRSAHGTWLDPGARDPALLSSLLLPLPGEAFTFHPVSPLVNRPENDTPACIMPVTEEDFRASQ